MCRRSHVLHIILDVRCGGRSRRQPTNHVHSRQPEPALALLRTCPGPYRRAPHRQDAQLGFHPAVSAGGPESKFGIEPDDLPAARAMAGESSVSVGILHGHLGSDLLDPQAHLELAAHLVGLANLHFPEVTTIDLGGGWGIPFAPSESAYDLGRFGSQLAGILQREDRPLRLWLEPGTYLVRDAGYLVTSVTEVRRRGTHTMVGVDANTNLLPGALLFGTEHPCVSTGVATEGPPVTIVGNAMQGGDVLRQHALLGRPEVGDRIVFGLVGAYGTVRASTFNERPRPAELLLEDGTVHVVRRAESIDELLLQQQDEPITLRANRAT